MTRGVPGTAFLRSDMVKETGGSAGQRAAPTTMRRRDSKLEGQKGVEWRCLSRREERASEVVNRSKSRDGDQLYGVVGDGRC